MPGFHLTPQAIETCVLLFPAAAFLTHNYTELDVLAGSSLHLHVSEKGKRLLSKQKSYHQLQGGVTSCPSVLHFHEPRWPFSFSFSFRQA